MTYTHRVHLAALDGAPVASDLNAVLHDDPNGWWGVISAPHSVDDVEVDAAVGTSDHELFAAVHEECGGLFLCTAIGTLDESERTLLVYMPVLAVLEGETLGLVVEHSIDAD